MFEAQRTSKFIEMKLGGETLRIYLGGIFQYKKFAECDQKINMLIERAKKTTQTKELEELMGYAIMNEIECVFGKSNSGKIYEFYEGNYDEMLISLMPFIKNEYIPAMLENIKSDSKAKIQEYK